MIIMDSNECTEAGFHSSYGKSKYDVASLGLGKFTYFELITNRFKSDVEVKMSDIPTCKLKLKF